MKKILFVCLGNICRSPTAEAVFAHKAQAAGLPVLVDSAGTGNWHVGEPPYGPMTAAAAQRGYDLSPLRARQFIQADFGSYDLIVVMDDDNLRDVEARRPKGSETPVSLMMDFTQTGQGRPVPDPYYTRAFDETLDLVEEAAAGLVRALQH